MQLFLHLLRDQFDDRRTLGVLELDGVRLYSCEDPDRGLDEAWTAADLAAAKVSGETAIAVGLHAVVLEGSAKFGPDCLTIKVPGHRVVRIHPGNTELDTEGCVMFGLTRSAGGVWDSRKATGILRDRLVPHLKSGGEVFLRISRASEAWAHAPFNPLAA